MSEITLCDLSDPNAAFAEIPSGTVDDPTIVRLPEGEIEVDDPIALTDKQWFHLVGGPTTFRFPTYGEKDGNGRYSRRHFTIGRLSDSIVAGIHIVGPHSIRSENFPDYVSYQSDKEFQHAFQISGSRRLSLLDCSGFQVAGDGMYVADSWDLHIARFRVEDNGRQGFAGIGGGRWLLDEFEVVNASRTGIDLEPIGAVDGVPRSVEGVEIRNSSLRGRHGIVFHRAGNVTLRDSTMYSVIKFPSIGSDVHRRWGFRIIDNVWPNLYAPTTKNWPIINVSTVNGIEVTGNKVSRDPNHGHSAGSALVRFTETEFMGKLTVRDNDTSGFTSEVVVNDGADMSKAILDFE